MGGQANTPTSNTWSMLTWIKTLAELKTHLRFSTGQSATSSVGDGTSMGVPQTEWGGTSWSTGEWGQINDNSAV